jgi:hypothetical protein
MCLSWLFFHHDTPRKLVLTIIRYRIHGGKHLAGWNVSGTPHPLPVSTSKHQEHLHGPDSDRDTVSPSHMFQVILCSPSTNTYIYLLRYFQPSPNALTPFSPVSSLNDPNFSTSCNGVSGNCANAWGLRIINSQNILVYGAGLYSFFNNYSTSKSSHPLQTNTMTRLLSTDADMYSLLNIRRWGELSVQDSLP